MVFGTRTMNKVGPVILFAILGGCATEETIKSSIKYKIKIVRPDGKIHKEYVVESVKKPQTGSDEGCLYLVDRGSMGTKEWEYERIPIGWMYDVEPLGEAE